MGVFEKVIAYGQEVIDLIPQKAPFVMVDTLYSSDETTTCTGLLISESNVLCKNGFFQEPGLIEHMAQSAALRVGYECKQKNETPPIGFIGDVKKLIINRLPLAGEELKTQITVLTQVMEISVISGKTSIDGQLIAECEMKIFLKQE